jgi:hypothetical protein
VAYASHVPMPLAADPRCKVGLQSNALSAHRKCFLVESSISAGLKAVSFFCAATNSARHMWYPAMRVTREVMAMLGAHSDPMWTLATRTAF